MNTSTNHLTTEQIYELLDNPEQMTGTHLNLCAQCQQEVEVLRTSLSGFRVATTNLAAAQPLARLRSFEPRRRFSGMSFQVFAASCATALVVITTSISVLAPHRTPAPVTPPASVAPVTRAAAESDDALLDGIDQDLSAPIPPSLAPLQIAAPTSSSNQRN